MKKIKDSIMEEFSRKFGNRIIIKTTDKDYMLSNIPLGTDILSFLSTALDTVEREAERKWKARGYVDATPDGNYALRLLRQAREDCDIKWSDNTAGLNIKNPLLKVLNNLQKERAKELEK